jgi:hypothetical protein
MPDPANQPLPDRPADEADDLLLWASDELESVSDARAAGVRKRLASDPHARQRAEALREQLLTIESVATGEPIDPSALRRATRAAKSAIAARASRSAVAGRIDPQTTQSSPSPVWRWARWPLAVAAVVVFGLAAFTLLLPPSAQLDPLVSFDPETDGVEETTDPPTPVFPGVPRLDEDWSADRIEALYDLPSVAWLDDEPIPAEDEWASLSPRTGLSEQLAQLDTLGDDATFGAAWDLDTEADG